MSNHERSGGKHDEDETIRPAFTVRRDHDEPESGRSETMKAVGEKAEAIKDAIVEKAEAIKDVVVEKAHELKDSLARKAEAVGHHAGELKDKAGEALSELKDKVASKLHGDPEPEEK